MANLVLKHGREKSLLRRHPWVFSGAIHHVSCDSAILAGQDIASGSTVDLLSFDGKFLARAAYSPHSQIRARVWTFYDEPVEVGFFRKRIQAALAWRATLDFQNTSDAYRLIHAESDALPGLVVDRYGKTLVLQSLTAGSEAWKETLADVLLEETGFQTIYERSDADVRELEGLPPVTGLLRGSNPSNSSTIREHGLKFVVNFATGHKTGFYLDQRQNRLRVRQLSENRDVLDCFCYSGGFTLNALAGGAKSVTAVDASGGALALARENIVQNGLPANRLEWIEADVFQALRKFRDEGRSFDLIILDPPKFAPTAAQAEKAARGYKDINRLGFLLLRRGGLLVTFSCSGGVDAALFQKIVASAALDAGVQAQIVETLAQAPDHPTALNFPEGAYLKGLVCLKK